MDNSMATASIRLITLFFICNLRKWFVPNTACT